MKLEVSSLIKNLEDGDPALVRVALQKLGKIGDPSALPAIEKLLSVEEDMIGFFARRAHQKIVSAGAPSDGTSAPRPSIPERSVLPDRPASPVRSPLQPSAAPTAGRRYDEIAEEGAGDLDDDGPPFEADGSGRSHSHADEEDDEAVSRAAANYDDLEEEDDDLAALMQAQGRGRARYSTSSMDSEDEDSAVAVPAGAASGAYDLGEDNDPYADEDLMLLLGKGGFGKSSPRPSVREDEPETVDSVYDDGAYSVDAYEIGSNIMDEIEADASSVSEENPFEKLLGNSWDDMLSDAGADVEVLDDSSAGVYDADDSGPQVCEADDDKPTSGHGAGDDGGENPFVPQSTIFGVPKAGPFSQEVDSDAKRKVASAPAAPNRKEALKDDGMPEWWKPQGEDEGEDADYRGKPYVPSYGKGRSSDEAERPKPGKRPFKR